MNKWFFAVKKRGDDIYDLSGLKVIDPPKGFYYADPFLIKRDGITYIFFELYDYEKGRIAYSILDDDLTITEPKVVIDSDTHMSFPALLEDGKEVYMTPENCLGGELVIYQAVKFPEVWDKVKVVANGRFDDPIMFKYKDKYRIMATEGGNNLKVFEADSVHSNWKQISSDCVQHSRSAGNIFDGIRPVQDSTPDYGRAIVFKDLETGKELKRIEPDWYPNLTGTHTFNMSEDYIIIDGRIKL